MKNNNIRILLDLDGVIRDWNSGINELYDINVTPTDWDHDFAGLLGISNTQFWEDQDHDFWVGLQKYEWADELLNIIESYTDNVCLLTSPTLNSAGFTQEWIRKNLPKYFNDKRYLIGPAKEFCANFGALLIDDRDQNCAKFIMEGGYTILFPQYWNENRIEREANNQINYTKNKLDFYAEILRYA